MKISFFTSWDTKCGIADYSNYFKNALDRPGLTIEIVPAGEKKKTGDFIKLGKLMNNADIAHIQHEYSFFGSNLLQQIVFFYIFLKQIKVPIVITLHELMLPRTGSLYQFRKRFLFLTQRLLFSNAALIFVHTNIQRETVLRMGIKNERVALLPHPIPEIKEESDSNEKYKEPFGISSKNVFAIFGFVCQRKGYDVAINAISEMEDAALIIAGGKNPNDESDYFQHLTGKIEDLKLQDRVLVTGYVPENGIRKVMGATDIVLAPFVDMHGSGSLSLSVAYHKPIIASDIEPMRELRKQGLGLELFKSGDSNDMKNKMLAVIKNDTKRTELVKLNMQYAKDFSYSNSAEKMIGIYKDIIGRQTQSMG